MNIGIPSYKRPNCVTVETLLKNGVSPSDITISVQTAEDYSEYKTLHENINIILCDADSAAGNRNNLIKTIGPPILLLDDDITSFCSYEDGRFLRRDNSFLEMVQQMKLFSEGISIIGVSPTPNNLTRRKRDRITPLCLLQGTVMYINEKVYFDERFKMVEDYEICLRVMRQGKTVLRLNDYSAYKPDNGTNIGGLHERYENGELVKYLKTIEKIYPEFKVNKAMSGGSIIWKR